MLRGKTLGGRQDELAHWYCTVHAKVRVLEKSKGVDSEAEERTEVGIT